MPLAFAFNHVAFIALNIVHSIFIITGQTIAFQQYNANVKWSVDDEIKC